MKTFLCKNKKPIIKWGMLPDGIIYEGNVPEGYQLAVCPSEGFIIVDVDRHGELDGFNNIPRKFMIKFQNTFNYKTKNNGRHYWFRYTGDKILLNRSTKLGIDLRTHKGYVIWYSNKYPSDAQLYASRTTPELNEWLEELFTNKEENVKDIK